jgi:hypothetical protein
MQLDGRIPQRTLPTTSQLCQLLPQTSQEPSTAIHFPEHPLASSNGCYAQKADIPRETSCERAARFNDDFLTQLGRNGPVIQVLE